MDKTGFLEKLERIGKKDEIEKLTESEYDEYVADKIEEINDSDLISEITDYYIVLQYRGYTFRDYFNFLISSNDILFRYIDANQEAFAQLYRMLEKNEPEFEF